MSPTWKAAIGVILVFILGWVGGSVTTLMVAHHRVLALTRDPQAMTVMLMRQTTRGLSLDESQKTQLRSLLFANVKERMELQKQIQPQVWTFNRQTVQQIDALLTPAQQQKFEDNLLLFKGRFGQNPLKTGSDSTAGETNAAPAGAATNGAVGAASPN